MDLRRVSQSHYDHTLIPTGEILKWFENEEAFWVYEGEPSPEKAHAELISGLCSDGFFDCLQILRYPNINQILAHQLARKLRASGKLGKVDWVVSSSYAAITFGYEVAKAFRAVFMMTEKDCGDPNNKKMVWRRMVIPNGARVLQVEELITTAGTFKEVRRAVEAGNPFSVEFIPVVAALIHRPPRLPMDYNGTEIVSLIEQEIKVFHPKECPYCRAGSPKYRPKSNWPKLIGKA